MSYENQRNNYKSDYNKNSNYKSNQNTNYNSNKSDNYKSENSKLEKGKSESDNFDLDESQAYIYGRNTILEALNEKDKISKLYIQFGTEGPNIDKILALTYKYKIPSVKYDKRKFLDLEAKINAKNNSQGVIALVNQIENVEFEELFDKALIDEEFPLIIALDELKDPHNFGAIARTVECSGAYGILYPSTNSVQVTPTAIKISAGALLITKTSKVNSLKNVLEYAKTLGFQIIGSEMNSEKKYYEIDFRKPTILVIGSEGEGIRPSIKSLCDEVINIPLKGKISSLNASVSAGIILYEAMKQKL